MLPRRSPLTRGWRQRASERWGLFVDAVWPTETEAIHAPHLLRVLDDAMPAHDLLWTTSYPYHTHAVGALVARTHRVPWVVDLRDPWTPNWVHRRKYRHARRVEAWLERAVFDRADAIVLTADALTALYREMFPRLASRFVTIHNAYDPDDAPGDVTAGEGPVRLVHFGNVYGPWSLSTVMRALAGLRAAGEFPSRGVVLENYGKMSDRDRDEASSLGLADVVRVMSPRPYADGVASLRRADALLLAAWDDPDARLYIQGKLYDYLLAGRDVIAETSHAEVRAMVADTGAGCVVAPGDVADMTARLRRVLRGERVTDALRDETRVRHWSAPEATRRLAALFDDVMARPRP